MHELPEETAVRLLRERGLSVSTAESCTGGLCAKRLTDVPGASAAFWGGVVSYTNAVKQRLLDVPAQLLAEYGAVSEPVARAMAEGARARTGTDLALSVTGVAGPERDDRGNPVGTVFIALAAPTGTRVCALRLAGGRGDIREESADKMLEMLIDYLEK